MSPCVMLLAPLILADFLIHTPLLSLAIQIQPLEKTALHSYMIKIPQDLEGPRHQEMHVCLGAGTPGEE